MSYVQLATRRAGGSVCIDVQKITAVEYFDGQVWITTVGGQTPFFVAGTLADVMASIDTALKADESGTTPGIGVVIAAIGSR